MKTISLKDLKLNLAKYAEAAARGEPIRVTRYNKPFVYLTPAADSSVRVGTRAGRYEVKPIAKEATRGKYLEVLARDREGQE